jgi:hypothetical protein
LVGRRDECDRIVNTLRGTRLVTLTGVGGVGKTRLALRVAKECMAARGSNTWVSLTSVPDDVRVADTITRAIGATDWSKIDVSGLELDEGRLLLVLDGCEHVITGCAEFVDRLLQSCAGVRVLATSREPLGVPGESVIPVAPLPMPGLDAPLDRLIENEAIELFVQRARARVPNFQLTAETAESVVRICRSVDGIPLAIELAAARITTMTVADIARGLEDPIGLLTGEAARRRSDARPSAHRLIGAIPDCRSLSAGCCAGSLFSTLVSPSRPHSRSARPTIYRRTRLPLSLNAWSPSHWSSPADISAQFGSLCSSRFADTQKSCSDRRGKKLLSESDMLTGTSA